jgi:pentatricopeptide repeat protein
VYTAALDAYRRSGDALKAVAVLSDMRTRQLQPSAKQYNLVLRTLQAEVRFSMLLLLLLLLLLLVLCCDAISVCDDIVSVPLVLPR